MTKRQTTVFKREAAGLGWCGSCLFLLLCPLLSLAEMSLFVVPLETSGMEPGQVRVLQGKIEALIAETPKYLLVSRDQLAAVLSEAKLQQSGMCSTSTCYMDLGGALGADKIVSGGISRIRSTYTLWFKLINTETGRQDLSITRNLTGSFEDLSFLVEVLVATLLQIDLGGGKAHQLAFCTFATKPGGATLSIEDEVKGTTPRNLRLAAGSYNLKFALAGYYEIVKTIVVDGLSEEFSETLSPHRGYLTVTTDVGEAYVIEGETILGKTPLTRKSLTIGSHRLIVVKPDYRKIEREVVIRKLGDQQTLELALKTLPASLLVFSTPDGASVAIDGVTHGKTPLTIDDVQTGQDLKLTLNLPGYRDEVQSLKLKPKEERVLDVLLKAEEIEPGE